MPILSYLPQLCHADTGNASLPTRRWTARPRHGPRCQSHDVGHGGASHARPGLPRSWCPGGRRPLHALTPTRLAQRKRALGPGMLPTFRWGLAWASRRMAREVGRHSSTR
jgi:hypothetical protein